MNANQPLKFGINVLHTYEQMLAAQGCVVLVFSEDLNIQYASNSIEKLLGIAEDEIQQTNLLDWIAEASRNVLETNNLHENSSTPLRLDWRTPSGYRPVEFAAYDSLNTDKTQLCTVRPLDTESDTVQPELYKRAVEASHAAVMITDAQAPDVPIIYVNPSFQKITGYSADEAIGRNCRFLQGEDQDQPKIQVLREAIAEGTDCQVVLRNYRKNGDLFWNELSIAPIHNDNGVITHFVGISIDITAQIVAEQQLADKHNLLRTLIDTISDHLFAYDQAGRYILVNDAYTKHLGGTTSEELIGTTAHDWFPVELAEQFEAENQQIFRTGEIFSTEEFYQVEGSPENWYSVIKAPLRNDAGDIIGLVGMSRNITQRKKQEIALQERESLYRLLARRLPDSIVLLYDEDLRYVLAEGDLFQQKKLGDELTPKFLEGKSLYDILPETTELHKAVQLGLQGVSSQIEFEYAGLHLAIHVVPVDTIEHRPKLGMVLAQDITEKRAAEDKLRASEVRTRALLEAIPDMIFLMAQDGVFTDFHAGINSNPMQPPETFIGKRITETQLPQYVANETLNRIEAAIATRKVQNHEYMLELPDGNRYYQSRLVALSENEVLSISRDITELQQAQQDLQKRVEELLILRQIDSEIAARLDINHVLKIALRETATLSQADAGFIALEENGELRIAHAVGDYREDFLEQKLQNESSIVARVLKKRQPELIRDLDNDPDYYVAISTTKAKIVIPLLSREQTIGVLNLETAYAAAFTEETFQILNLIAGRIGIALDNARLHRQTESQLAELRSLYDTVSHLEQLKTDMIRIASHDLRNPVSAILGYLSLIDPEANLTEEQINYLNRIRTSAKQIQTIISDILSLERIEEAAAQPSEKINICELVEDTTRLYVDQIAAKMLTHTIKVPAKVLIVEGDPAQLQEAIANLVVNAIKYTPSDGHININVGQRGEHVHFTVEDTGYGIPEAQQDRLFEPFYRATTEETRQQEGTGLGLNLVKNIIERHRGEIIFDSEYGNGSTFGFKLPIAK